MRFTKIPETTFSEIQLNAGVLLANFTPADGSFRLTDIIGATTGGVSFSDSVTFTDFGEDIDNCPKNMKELKQLDTHEVTMSGTFVTVSAKTVKTLIGVADIASGDKTKVVPRNNLLDTDFIDIWWVGDYSDKNGETKGGYVAIHLINALNTGGFQIQSTDKGKGQFAFSFMGHYSMSAQDTVPYEVYVKAGAAEAEEEGGHHEETV